MLRIWGRLASINVQKVVWAARECGIAFERIEAGGPHRIVDTPEYLAMNPNAKVPVVDDDGFVLWESNAIVRYLAERHARGTLWPEDPRVRADADRWMDWQQSEVNPAMRDAFWQLVRTPEGPRDAALVQRSAAASERLIAMLDRRLADHAYVAGDAFTMGDIPIGCQVHRWLGLPLARAACPNVERWYRTLKARPAADVLSRPVE